MLPRVPLSACLHRWQEAEMMSDYFSAALNRKTTQASRRMRFTTFPPFLVVQLNRCEPPYLTASAFSSAGLAKQPFQQNSD